MRGKNCLLKKQKLLISFNLKRLLTGKLDYELILIHQTFTFFNLTFSSSWLQLQLVNVLRSSFGMVRHVHRVPCVGRVMD